MAATLETTEERRRKRSPYTTEDVERGLLAVAYHNGSAHHASEQLAREGLEIPRGTLAKWKTQSYAARYQEIRAELVPAIHARIGTAFEDSILRTEEVKREALEQLKEKLLDLKPADLAGAIRNLGTDQGIAATHARVFRDKPQVVEHRHTVDEDLAWLARSGVIEGTARETPPPPELPRGSATTAGGNPQRVQDSSS